jgi:hypothetical protein
VEPFNVSGYEERRRWAGSSRRGRVGGGQTARSAPSIAEERRGVHGATAPRLAVVACRPEVEDEGGVGQLGHFGRVGRTLSGLGRLLRPIGQRGHKVMLGRMETGPGREKRKGKRRL